MSGALRLIWRYVSFHWGKSLVLVACLFLTAFLPIAISVLLRQFNRQILSRAEASPAVLGHAGSPLELTLHALFFSRRDRLAIPFSECQKLEGGGLARAVPLFVRHTARGAPVVGTSRDYFDFRDSKIESGRFFIRLGECVLGNRVANRLKLSVGDDLVSDRENLIDLSGQYPLQMKVVGILAPNGTADDEAVWVDLKTAWVMEGLGHGHAGLGESTSKELLLDDGKEHKVASAAVLPFTSISAENIASFHFHGAEADFPLTAILVKPDDAKSAAVLRDRSVAGADKIQYVVPVEEIKELMGVMFQTEKFFLANTGLIAAATMLLMLLIVVLSVQLRRPEMETLRKIGCSKGIVYSLLAGEFVFAALVSGLLLTVAVWGTVHFAEAWVQGWVSGG